MYVAARISRNQDPGGAVDAHGLGGGGLQKAICFIDYPVRKQVYSKKETKCHLLEMSCEKVHVHSCSKEKAAQNGVVELKSRNAFPISEACE